MSGEWVHTSHGSDRVVRRFAWHPVRTFDAGWIWMKRYWLRESIYGWGFHDKHAYFYRSVDK